MPVFFGRLDVFGFLC